MLIQANALYIPLADQSVHCVVTSPPYWGLRKYEGAQEMIWPAPGMIDPSPCAHEWVTEFKKRAGGGERDYGSFDGAVGRGPAVKLPESNTCKLCGAWRGQLGLEPTIEMYLAHMVQIFREVRRVLRSDGTLWLNLGDSYAASPAGNFSKSMPKPADGGAYRENKPFMNWAANNLKPKDLCGIPWRVAFALQADGWFLRSDIIWSKPNPMPESVTDRPTKAHEYIFLLTKSARYFYDADAVRESFADERMGRDGSQLDSERNRGGRTDGFTKPNGIDPSANGGRNMRSVWWIPTQPYAGAHFATFPEEIPYKCIAAGTSERGVCPQCAAPWARVTDTTRTFESGSGRAGNLPIGKNGAGLQGGGETLDVRRGPVVHTQTTGWRPTCACQSPVGTPALQPALVLDPFGGSGTVGEVALKMGRRFVLLDLAYQHLQRERIGLFA